MAQDEYCVSWCSKYEASISQLPQIAPKLIHNHAAKAAAGMTITKDNEALKVVDWYDNKLNLGAEAPEAVRRQ